MIALSEAHKEIKKLILDTPPPGKHCARSAIRHIEKAWEIKDVDREMAGFRALTGEEESVTAIFHSLKRRNYKSADKLNPRNHVHKCAVYPFLIAVSEAFEPFKSEMEPQLELHAENGEKKFRVRITVKGPDGKKLWAFPEPPLNFNVWVNNKLYDFAEQFSVLASDKKAKDMLTAIRKAANYRNQILYASQKGIPSLAEPIDKYLLKRRDVIFLNLAIFLIIDQCSEIQLFAQQALAALLKMLKIIDDMAPAVNW